MPVAPALQAVLDQMSGFDIPVSDDPATLIAGMRSGTAAFASLGAGAPEPMHGVDDVAVAGPGGDVTVRVYRPSEPPAGTTPPVIVYLHGGGWAAGDLETHDGICRRLAKAADAVVASVDYRRPPEHPFPAALEDSYTAASWVVEHAAEIGVDGGRVAIAGDSAGGNLTAAVTLRARAAGGPDFVAQALVYPATDVACQTPSFTENGSGYLLTKDAMDMAWGMYLGPDGDPADAYVSVLRAPDLSGLPPALVITAEFDVLRDEGEAYGARLDGFDVPVSVHRYDGMIHGFLGMRELVAESDTAIEEIATFLGKRFAAA